MNRKQIQAENEQAYDNGLDTGFDAGYAAGFKIATELNGKDPNEALHEIGGKLFARATVSKREFLAEQAH